jgi:hypothetical protein
MVLIFAATVELEKGIIHDAVKLKSLDIKGDH